MIFYVSCSQQLVALSFILYLIIPECQYDVKIDLNVSNNGCRLYSEL